MFFAVNYAIKNVRILLRKCKVTVMKMIHVISLLLVVLGGFNFALSGIGINLFHTMFGGANLTILYIVIGVSTLYHVVPVLKTHLAAL